MEKFSGIFRIILLIFLENLVIFFVGFVDGGGMQENVGNFWNILKTIFWENFRSTSRML